MTMLIVMTVVMEMTVVIIMTGDGNDSVDGNGHGNKC